MKYIGYQPELMMFDGPSIALRPHLSHPHNAPPFKHLLKVKDE
jgi:hypothetical protein